MSLRFNNSFGGTLLKNSHAKTARPLLGRSYLVVVLKTRSKNFQLNQKLQQHKIRTVLRDQAKRLKLQLKELHCNETHIQFIVYLSRKKNFKAFIRSVTGTLALKLSGANKHKALSESFWACRPWTCVMTEDIAFHFDRQKGLMAYLKEILMMDPKGRGLLEIALGP